METIILIPKNIAIRHAIGAFDRTHFLSSTGIHMIIKKKKGNKEYDNDEKKPTVLISISLF